MAYLGPRRKNPMLKSRDVVFDCCDATCWSCGNTYYGNAKDRELHKCYRCRKEKRPYNPDISPTQ